MEAAGCENHRVWFCSLFHRAGDAYLDSEEKQRPVGESFILRDESFIREAENVNITDDYGQNALFTAVQRAPVNLRKYDAVALLIEKGIEVNHRDKFGRTPLYMASRSGTIADMEKLLEAGVDPNVQDRKYGHSPIHVAAIKLGGKYLDGLTKGINGAEAIEYG